MTEPGQLKAPLRVLVVHNRYQQPGGEDMVVEAESALLRSAGHAVERYERHNDEVSGMGRLGLARDTLWSARTVRDVSAVIDRFRPDVMHVHNTFPLISPSVYAAARRADVPVVQTLHNFRLLCPQAQMFRDGRVCDDCVGHVPWRAVLHRCYRGSVTQSAVAAAAVQFHRWRGTWRDDVAAYIVLDDGFRQAFVAGGLPAGRLRVKPNFVDVPLASDGVDRNGWLYVGRLTTEKGLALLTRPGILPEPTVLTVIGDGPLAGSLESARGVHGVGWQPRDAVLGHMRRARALVVPSLWPEMFGLVVIEAYACGLPVIASRIGALAQIVEHGTTGLLFEPGDAESLSRQLRWAADHPAEMAGMGTAARRRYEVTYSPAANLRTLEAVYRSVIAEASTGRRAA